MSTGGPPTRRRTPIKFDNETAAKIVTFLRAGNFLEIAASVAGISRQTLHKWLRKGNAPDAEEKHPRLAAWAKEVNEAQALAEAGLLNIVDRAAQLGVWQAACWHLERKFPERWGRRDHIEHSGPGGGPVATADVTRHMTTGEKRARLAQLLAEFAEQQKAEAEREEAEDDPDDGSN